MIAVFSSFVLSHSLAQSVGMTDGETFARYPAQANFTGAYVLPRFNDRDRDFRQYRSRLSDDVRRGPNFSSSFRVTAIGCGTSCVLYYMTDLRDGRVTQFPLSGEPYMALVVRTNLSSRAAIAYWIDGEHCLRQVILLSGGVFERQRAQSIGGARLCYSLN